MDKDITKTSDTVVWKQKGSLEYQGEVDMSQDEERLEKNIKFCEDKIAKLMKENAPEKKIKALVDEQGNQMRILGIIKDSKELAKGQNEYTR